MTTLPKAVVVHGLAEAGTACAAAARTGCRVALVSAPGGGSQGGALWFLELVRHAVAAHPGAQAVGVLDCADHAGRVQGAIAAGVGHVVFTGRPDVAERLAAIAAAQGAVLLTARPPALDLRGRRDPLAACLDWLSTDTVG